MLPGRLLEKAGVRDDGYFALTQLIAPQIAALTHAPGAPERAEDNSEQQEDDDMANVAVLRMKGKLDALLPKATLQQTAGVLEDAPPLQSGDAEAAGVQQ
jgi:hypothetical protein